MFTSFEKLSDIEKTKVTSRNTVDGIWPFSVWLLMRGCVTWGEKGHVGPGQRPQWTVFGSGSVSSPKSHLPYLHEPGYCFCVTLQPLANQEFSQVWEANLQFCRYTQQWTWPLIMVHSPSSPMCMECSILDKLVHWLKKMWEVTTHMRNFIKSSKILIANSEDTSDPFTGSLSLF